MQLTPKTAQEISALQAGDLIQESHNILIITHYRPDGDAIGSSLALASSLQALGKSVCCLDRDETPDYLKFLERGYNHMHQSIPAGAESPDLIIALDCATIERLGHELVQSLPQVQCLVIDHHITNERYGDYLILDSQAAATGEILYGLLKDNDFPIPDQARDALYVAISTDTGSLQYSSSSVHTYQTMTDLVGLGADVAALNAQTYFNHSPRRLFILRECLQRFQIEHEGQVSFWAIPYAIQEEIGIQAGDTEGLMDLLRGVQGVRVCFTLEESASGTVRLSVRSKDEGVDVSQVCAHFGGGGHRMAAGAALEMPLEKCIKQVLEVIGESL